jgi:hypothetical protein
MLSIRKYWQETNSETSETLKLWRDVIACTHPYS